MPTRNEATWLYRCILGREPESEQTIEWVSTYFATFEQARQHFLFSEEFKIKQRALDVAVETAAGLHGTALHDFVVRRLTGTDLGQDRSASLLEVTRQHDAARAVAGIASKLQLRVAVALGGGRAERLALDLIAACGQEPVVLILGQSSPRQSAAGYSSGELSEFESIDGSIVRLGLAPDLLYGVLERFGIAPELFILGDSVDLAAALPGAFARSPENGLVLVDLAGPRSDVAKRQFIDIAEAHHRDGLIVDDVGLLQKSFWFSPLRYEPLTPQRATTSRTRKLALAAIVKNEAARVGQMIASCAGLIDYATFVDTGSTDDTIAVVTRQLEYVGIPFQIIRSEFRDFATARNEAIDAVPLWCHWILMLDGDEHLDPADTTRWEQLMDSDFDAWLIPRYNFVDENKDREPAPYPDRQRRLFRNYPDKRIRYFGAVHEVLVGVERWGLAPPNTTALGGEAGGPHIHHMGQVNRSHEEWIRRHAFYTRLAEG